MNRAKTLDHFIDRLTIRDLKEYIKELPDSMFVTLENPDDRYGVHEPLYMPRSLETSSKYHSLVFIGWPIEERTCAFCNICEDCETVEELEDAMDRIDHLQDIIDKFKEKVNATS